MTAKPWVVVAVMAMMCLMPYQSVDLTSLSEDSVKSESSGNSHEILLMGNSYVASNSLKNLVDGVMNAASQPANVSALTGGGMRLSQHASNVASAGHQWNTTLNNGNWDWVILQDQSQIPGFPRSQAEWGASKDGAVELAEVIEDNGGETVLMMTWGRRDGDTNNAWRFPDFSTMQDELESGYLDYRDNISANGGNAWVAPVGLAFEHIHDKIVAEGGTPTNSGNTFYNLYTGDGSHPSLSGSYLAAVVLYATITGNDPVGLSHSTSLSNGLVLELQQAAAATVFNETSHLDYPWQTNSNNSYYINTSLNHNPGIAFEWALQNGDWSEINDIIVSKDGSIYAVGTHKSIPSEPHSPIVVDNCSFTKEMYFFIAKFDSFGNCLWLSNVTGTFPDGSYKENQMYDYETNKISIDDFGNIYITGDLVPGMGNSVNDRLTYTFGQISVYASNCWIDGHSQGCTIGFIAKLNNTGVWQWVKTGGNAYNNEFGQSFTSLDTYPNGTSIVAGYYTDEITLDSFSDNRNSDGSDLELFVGMIDSNGSWVWSKFVGHHDHNQKINDISIDKNGDILVTGKIYITSSFGNSSLFGNQITFANGLSPGTNSFFVAKLSQYGEWLWAKTWDNASSSSSGLSITTDSSKNVLVTGYSYGANSIDNIGRVSSGGLQNSFLTKLDTNGNWIWLRKIGSTGTVISSEIVNDHNDNLIVGGKYTDTIILGAIQLPLNSGGFDLFLAKINPNGTWVSSISAGSSGDDRFEGLYYNDSREIYTSGLGKGDPMNFGSVSMLNQNNKEDWHIAKISDDYDFDTIPDSLDDDIDGDLIVDLNDNCLYSDFGFKSTLSLDHDSDGCDDGTEDDDDDNDMLNDTLDNCPKGMTGWIRTNASDLDDDGCMDALEDYDDDNDGFEDYEDYCSRIPGNSTFEFEKGCPDADGDGRPDILDPFKNDPTEWSDMDGDEVGDNSDAFPLDATQQYDTDGDTYGDEEFGNAGDSCPTVFGNSTIDRYGCLDTDGDGWSDEGDDFPLDPTEYLDSDSDGYPDSSDDFPFDPTQWKDSDGDGYGDNPQGNLGDAYPNDASRYADSDRDGIDDQADAFPYDPTQWEDADGDGMGDNPMGIGADKFPDDPTQWGDIDGDGYGDNSTGNNPDAFPTDATQWSDMDGDGYGDNPTGRLYDLFPENPTQWEDADGDGLGDNQSGTDADPYLNDFDNDGYNDTIDILPRVASPGDLDNDKCMDGDDDFWDNPLECLDTDKDGIGNNADGDDDNDEWTDADEIRAGTDPLDPNSTPVDSFEIQIGNIGLGAWDLIGIFGGVPIFGWILFGFVTRNARCARYEEDLEKAQSREELEQVALRWEYSLMLRLLGPHQGIRLERLRSELDDKFENAELLMSNDGFEPMTEIEQAPIVDAEQKDIPAIETTPSPDTPADQTDEHGYSWLNYNGQNWYRTASDTEWTRHE